MFEKLRNAFSIAAKSFGEKELKEKDIDEVLFELEIALLESDVATEVIDALKSDLKKQLIGSTVNKDTVDEVVKQELRKSISNMFDEAGKVDIVSNIQKNKEKGESYIISFMGINGTGKTTTIAKIANLLRENKYSVVIAAADTYRAGAIEQISEHGKRLNIKVIAQNYGSDPAAVARDAVLYAKSHKIDCILIDTAGRMQTSKNLMDQISKINKVVNPDLKLFVGDSLAGNDTVSQAREFYNYTAFDGAILTKSDADARGGAAISIVKVTSSPILYLGVGQEYKDLKPFDKDVFLETLFGPEEVVEGVKKRVLEPKVELKPEPKVELKPSSEQEISEDPFAGISTNDIEKYSALFDVPPPENDNQARKLASDIQKWISTGRPKTKQTDGPKEPTSELKTEKETIEESKDEKPIKKRSLFGWMKK
ncbi:MAG: signal recognition particle-docking protein FtsY [Candidatus Nitrosotalea sp.]|nr:signal recognition particle-docking protein FtsY [Candidatus Nitrosotalea sp.]